MPRYVYAKFIIAISVFCHASTLFILTSHSSLERFTRVSKDTCAILQMTLSLANVIYVQMKLLNVLDVLYDLIIRGEFSRAR